LALPVRNDGEPTDLCNGRCALAHPHANGGHETAGLVPPTSCENFLVIKLRRQLRQQLPQWWKVHVAVRLRLGDVRRPLQGQHLSGVLGSQHEWLSHGTIVTRGPWGAEPAS